MTMVQMQPLVLDGAVITLFLGLAQDGIARLISRVHMAHACAVGRAVVVTYCVISA
jgi:hypothetical protein